MEVIEDISALHAWTGNRIGRRRVFVPTMGALHEGHMSLCDIARAEAGEEGDSVASIFVNPLQFGPGEDLDRYPRTLDADLEKCEAHGVDLVFVPTADTLYPRDRSILIHEKSLSLGLCGGSRPGHFDGVCTVVAKLFNLVLPTAAVFGEKDYQQLAVIRRMVRDLNFPIEIIGGAIVREADGLAMSSRNAYLSPQEREQAVIINRALAEADRSASSTAAIAKTTETITSAPLARIDYIEVVDLTTLEPVPEDYRGKARILAAVFFGKTRLIDNREISLGAD